VKLDVSMLTHDLKSIPDYARKVEAMGYDCLWPSETQHEPYLPLAVRPVHPPDQARHQHRDGVRGAR
jgi:hypothetical protein